MPGPHQYLSYDQYAQRTSIPPKYITAIEQQYPGHIDLQLQMFTAMIDARLRKNYAAPFDTDHVPLVVQLWLVALCDYKVMERRGYNPGDSIIDRYAADYEQANKDLLEAANSETGLFDLPLRSDTTASGRDKPRVVSYCEASPFVGQRMQRERGRAEDKAGRGSRFP
jgi:hypothetical protein